MFYKIICTNSYLIKYQHKQLILQHAQISNKTKLSINELRLNPVPGLIVFTRNKV